MNSPKKGKLRRQISTYKRLRDQGAKKKYSKEFIGLISELNETQQNIEKEKFWIYHASMLKNLGDKLKFKNIKIEDI